MSLNASQQINNLKKSFNEFIETQLSGETVNFDQDPFETTGLSSWYSLRYTEIKSDPVGMGDLIDETTDKKGRIHTVTAELSAWTRDDEHRVALGEMADKIVVIAETESIDFYDYTDPESPTLEGTIKVYPDGGTFSPVWGGSSGGVLKSSSDIHMKNRVKGYVQKIRLTTIAEV